MNLVKIAFLLFYFNSSVVNMQHYISFWGHLPGNRSRLVFDQVTGYCSLVKLTQKFHYHTRHP